MGCRSFGSDLSPISEPLYDIDMMVPLITLALDPSKAEMTNRVFDFVAGKWKTREVGLNEV